MGHSTHKLEVPIVEVQGLIATDIVFSQKALTRLYVDRSSITVSAYVQKYIFYRLLSVVKEP